MRDDEELDSKDVLMLWLAAALVVFGLCWMFNVPAHAQYGGLGGGWGIYGPYGAPPPGAYGPPRPRRPPPMPYGPQMEPCIYYGDCRGPRYPRPMPPREDFW